MIAEALPAAFVFAFAAGLAAPMAPSRGCRRPSWARGPVRARIHARRRVRGSTGRLGPSWACEPYNATDANTPPA